MDRTLRIASVDLERPAKLSRPVGAVDWDHLGSLAAGCRQKDPAVFNILVKSTSGRLRRFLSRLVTRGLDVDDLLQETYLRAWRSIGEFRGDASLGTWLIRIAVNVARTAARGKERDRRQSLEPDAAWTQGGGSEERDEKLVEAFRKAVDGLSVELRTVFVLHETEGMSYKQLSEALECPMGTVMSRLHRARAQILETLSEREDELGS
jgi:RNA polymerase sigma-70 factor (ECF subfamily)